MANFSDQLAEYQEEYDTLAQTIEADIDLVGSRLESALTKQCNIQRKWGSLGANLAGLHDEAKNISNTMYGDAFAHAQSNNYKSVNSTEAKWEAERDDDYNAAKTTELKIYRLRKEVEAVVGVIESRKYILKNLTDSIINQCNNHRLE